MPLLRRLFCVAIFAPAAIAHAQNYPSRPITIVVPFSAGGATDVIARAVGKRLGEELGQAVVVENRTGANGQIAVNSVVKAKPDGYTLLVGNNTPNVFVPLISKEPTHDPRKDLTPLAIVAYSPTLLIVNAESPYRTLGDLVNAGKAPGAAGINFGASSGLMSGLLKAATGAKIVYVPYRGEANSTLAVLAKEVDVAFVTGAAAAPHIQAGKIRAVANLASARSALYPNVPTAMESGVPGVKVDLWFGFLGPAGMPPQVVQVLERKFRQIAMEPEIKSRFEQLQMTSAAIGPQEFSAQLDAEFSYLTPLVKAMVDRGELK